MRLVSNKVSTKDAVNYLMEQNMKGVVVYLNGPMGSGKTTLVRRYLRSLSKINDLVVTSPSFSIINLYKYIKVAHIDLQNISHKTIIYSLDIHEWHSKGYTLLIEWGEIIQDLYLKGDVIIQMTASHKVTIYQKQ